MRAISVAIAVSMLAVAGTAQRKQLRIPPTNTLPRANNYPFAGPPMRYQQWYSPSEWLKVVKHPVRVVALEFKTLAGGSGLGSQTQLDMEIALANGPTFGPGAVFDANLASGKVIVLPRQKVTLPKWTAGWPLKLQFPRVERQFVWDGKSAVVMDVKLFGNGRPGNQAFSYDFEFTVLGVNQVTRLFSIGAPGSQTTARVIQPNTGIITRFTTEEGVAVSFGRGCPGTGGKTPVAGTTGGLPKPNNPTWTHTLTDVVANQPAVLFIGTSNTQWGQRKLPLDLSFIRAQPCFLLVEPLLPINTITVGGRASVGVPTPPTTNYVGLTAYFQWFVRDPGAGNIGLAASQGIAAIFGQ